jgi:hypothetical protein
VPSGGKGWLRSGPTSTSMSDEIVNVSLKNRRKQIVTMFVPACGNRKATQNLVPSFS